LNISGQVLLGAFPFCVPLRWTTDNTPMELVGAKNSHKKSIQQRTDPWHQCQFSVSQEGCWSTAGLVLALCSGAETQNRSQILFPSIPFTFPSK
jgi:hypothetical protein